MEPMAPKMTMTQVRKAHATHAGHGFASHWAGVERKSTSASMFTAPSAARIRANQNMQQNFLRAMLRKADTQAFAFERRGGGGGGGGAAGAAASAGAPSGAPASASTAAAAVPETAAAAAAAPSTLARSASSPAVATSSKNYLIYSEVARQSGLGHPSRSHFGGGGGGIGIGGGHRSGLAGAGRALLSSTAGAAGARFARPAANFARQNLCQAEFFSRQGGDGTVSVEGNRNAEKFYRAARPWGHFLGNPQGHSRPSEDP